MIFAVGQNTLGYANSEIDKKIINALRKGNTASLNYMKN